MTSDLPPTLKPHSPDTSAPSQMHYVRRFLGRGNSASALGAQPNSCSSLTAAAESSSTQSSSRELLACLTPVPPTPPRPSPTRDARDWEMLLDDIFDSLDGATLLRAERVCRSWRSSSQDPVRADRRLTKLAANNFRIPTSTDGQLLLWGADSQTKPDQLQMELILCHEGRKGPPTGLSMRDIVANMGDNDSISGSQAWGYLHKHGLHFP